MTRRRSAFWGGLIGGALGPTVARASRRLVRGFGKVLLFALLAFWGWLYNLTGSAKGAALMLLLLIACLVMLVGLLRSNRQVHLPALPGQRECWLYRLWDEHNRLMYVGIAFDPDERLEQHRREKYWADGVHHRTLERFDSRAEAKSAESWAIKHERPLFNIAEMEAR